MQATEAQREAELDYLYASLDDVLTDVAELMTDDLFGSDWHREQIGRVARIRDLIARREAALASL